MGTTQSESITVLAKTQQVSENPSILKRKTSQKEAIHILIHKRLKIT